MNNDPLPTPSTPGTPPSPIPAYPITPAQPVQPGQQASGYVSNPGSGPGPTPVQSYTPMPQPGAAPALQSVAITDQQAVLTPARGQAPQPGFANAPTMSATPPATSGFAPAGPGQATSSQPPAFLPPSPGLSPASAGGGKKALKVLLALCTLLLIAALAAGAAYTVAKNSANKEKAKLTNQLATLASPQYALPAGAKKVSECVPATGIRYLPEDSDPEYGPYILANKAGKVLGLEYIIADDMYADVADANPPARIIEKDSPLYGWKFDHSEFSHIPQGNSGLAREHSEVRFYTSRLHEQLDACQ